MAYVLTSLKCFQLPKERSVNFATLEFVISRNAFPTFSHLFYVHTTFGQLTFSTLQSNLSDRNMQIKVCLGHRELLYGLPKKAPVAVKRLSPQNV